MIRIEKIAKPNAKSKKPAAKAADVQVVSRLKTEKPAGSARKRGRPSTGREQVTLMIASDVLDKYRATGEGWRLLIEETLRKAMDKR